MIVFFILGTCYAEESRIRTWEAVSGKKVEAEFVSIFDKQVTYDLARLMEPKEDPLRCSEFANAIIERF